MEKGLHQKLSNSPMAAPRKKWMMKELSELVSGSPVPLQALHDGHSCIAHGQFVERGGFRGKNQLQVFLTSTLKVENLTDDFVPTSMY